MKFTRHCFLLIVVLPSVIAPGLYAESLPVPTPTPAFQESNEGVGFVGLFLEIFAAPIRSKTGFRLDDEDDDYQVYGYSEIPKGKDSTVQAGVATTQVGLHPFSGKENLPSLVPGKESQIEAGNSSGVAVGTCQDKSNNFVACVWDPQGTNPLSASTKWKVAALPNLSNSTFSEALGINEDGVAVGYSRLPGFTNHAVLWTNGTIVKLNDMASNSTLDFKQAYAINSSGQIVGQAFNASNNFTAFLLDSDGTATDLGELLGSFFSQASAINVAGQIVGQAILSGHTHAVLWDTNGSNMDLGVLPGGTSSQAEAINSSGVIVGESTTTNFPTNSMQHAVLWGIDGTIQDLNDLAPDDKLVYTSATAVDDQGDVFVQAQNAAKKQYGIMLVLHYPPVITIPPASNSNVVLGSKVSLSVTATGTPPLKYQWFFNGKKIARATASTYKIAMFAAKNIGSYTVTVSNSVGSVTSSPASLSISM